MCAIFTCSRNSADQRVVHVHTNIGSIVREGNVIPRVKSSLRTVNTQWMIVFNTWIWITTQRYIAWWVPVVIDSSRDVWCSARRVRAKHEGKNVYATVMNHAICLVTINISISGKWSIVDAQDLYWWLTSEIMLYRRYVFPFCISVFIFIMINLLLVNCMYIYIYIYTLYIYI